MKSWKGLNRREQVYDHTRRKVNNGEYVDRFFCTCICITKLASRNLVYLFYLLDISIESLALHQLWNAFVLLGIARGAGSASSSTASILSLLQLST